MKDNNKVFRPFLDDVERLSYGKGATKQRGTGSRFVCHRLNQEERATYEVAKQKGYLTVKGTGYRKERKGSPLHNIWRQRCDALKTVCLIVEKRPIQDTVVMDFSTLRVPNDAPYVAWVVENTLKQKYAELYDNMLTQQTLKGTDSVLLDSPIDWETVKTKAIWAVNERNISILCSDRSTAKLLAEDVLKESSNFENIEFCCEETAHQTIVRDRSIASEKTQREQNAALDDDGIDWNDI